MWLYFLPSVRTCKSYERIYRRIGLYRRAFPGVVPCWRRFGWVSCWLSGCHKCSRFSSDAYDVYYANPALLPPVHADPAEYPPSDPRELDPDHGDATVEDICDFIVEYINSDVMVCSLSCL
jgi:hypothetical protein